MIRINLLAAERERAKKPRGALIPAAHRVTIGASVILIATMLGIGWWFWILHQQSTSIDQAIAHADAETLKLRGVLSQVQKFESRKAQLQQRVTLIEQLRSGQSAPVYVLDKIAASLASLGGTLADVVRTRVYLRDAAQWERVARVHGRYFGKVRPANTLLEIARLVGEEYAVEIEAEAIVG